MRYVVLQPPTARPTSLLPVFLFSAFHSDDKGDMRKAKKHARIVRGKK